MFTNQLDSNIYGPENTRSYSYKYVLVQQFPSKIKPT